MRFDFDSSRYAALFRSGDGRQLLQSVIDDSGLIDINYNWWRSQFSVNPNATPTAADGTATYKVNQRQTTSAPLMDWRAPLGDAHPFNKQGLSFYTGSIPDFISRAIAETAMERQYKEDKFAEFGSDADIIREWTKDVQFLIDQKDQTLNHLSAQLISTGKIVYTAGMGITGPQQKAEIPEENFEKAGAKVWTAPDAKLFDQMVIIEKKFRDRTGYTGAMKWQITKKMYQDVFLKNAQVKEWVGYLRNLNTNSPVAAPDIAIILDEMFNAAVKAYDGLSPIDIVVEKEKNSNWAGDEMVHGWNDKVAVLRPAGDAGLIMHTSILDEKLANKYGNKVIDSVFANIDGFSRLANFTMADGQYKSWETRLMMSATPALTEFLYHVIVDTTVADS